MKEKRSTIENSNNKVNDLTELKIPMPDNNNNKKELKGGKRSTAKLLKEIERKHFDYSSLVYEELLFDHFLNTLKKPAKDRVVKDIHILVKTLNKTELNPNFNEENASDKEIPKKLYFCAMSIEYVFCPKDTFLLKEGDIADCFFVLLKGSLKVLKKSENITMLNGEEYVNSLYKIFQNGFADMIKQTIERNASVFYVDNKDLPYLKYINFIVIYRSLLNNKNILKEKFYNLFYKYEIHPSDFFIDIDVLDRQNYDKKYDYMSKCLSRITSHFIGNHIIDFSKYSYIEEFNNQRTVYLYDYLYLITIKAGKVIGDYSLQNKSNFRLASLYTENDSILGKISQDVYDDYIAEERLREFNSEISFLIVNFCFKSIPPYLFKKKYFYDFIPMEISKGTILCRIRQEIDTVYFIKEGELEIKLDITLNDLRNITLQLIEKTDYKPETTDNILKNRIKQSDYFINEAKKKRSFKICILGSTEMVGFEAYFYNISSFYTCVVVSDKAKLSKVETRILNSIANEEKSCYEDIKELAKYKTTMIIKRLLEIYNVITNLIEKNYNENKDISLLESPKINIKKNEANIKNTVYLSPEVYRKINIPNIKDIEDCSIKKSRNYSEEKFKTKVKSLNNLILPQLNKDVNYDIQRFKEFNKSIRRDDIIDKNIIKSIEGIKNNSIINFFNLLPKINVGEEEKKSLAKSSNKYNHPKSKNLNRNNSQKIKLMRKKGNSYIHSSLENMSFQVSNNKETKSFVDKSQFHHLFIIKKKNKDDNKD